MRKAFTFDASHWLWLTIGLATLWALLAWIALVTTVSLTEELKWVNHTNQVMSRIYDLKSRITDVETAQRGYIITGDATYLEPYTNASSAIDGLTGQLQLLTQDNPEQQDKLDGLRDTLRDRLIEASATVSERQTGGFDAARRLIVAGTGKRLHDSIRRQLDAMIAIERDLLIQRSEKANLRQTWLTASMVAALLLVGLGISISSRLGRQCLRTERRLKASEARYRLQFEAAPLPMFVVDLHSGDIIDQNAAAANLFGDLDEKGQPIPIDRLFHHDERAAVATRRIAVLAGADDSARVWRMVDSHGDDILCHISAGTIDFGEDQARLVVASDVTAREHALARMHQSEARFQEVFNLQYQWMATLSPDGQIEMVNDLFVEAVGKTRSQLSGSNINSVGLNAGSTDKEVALNPIVRRVTDSAQSAFFQLRFHHRTGSARILQAVLRPVLHDGRVSYLIFQALDVTDQVRGREALAAGERRLLAAQTRAGMCNWEWDGQGRLWWSANTSDFLHLPPSRRPATLTDLAALADGDDAARLTQLLAELPEMVGPATLRFRGAPHMKIANRQFELVAECLRIEGQATPVLAGSIMDITEPLALERRLQQSQRLEAVGQLTGGIAHDFNNLLTVIIGNSEVLADELAGDAGLREFAELSLSAASRAAELTTQLLAFARRQPLEPAVLNPARLVRDMNNLLRKTLTPQIDPEFVTDAGAWDVNVDATQLESAILNLAINARDAMPDGGKLTVEVANVRLDTAYAAVHSDVQPGSYVMIAVSDSGHGMTPDILDRAFEPFFTTKREGDNSGLGLSMVHGFVKQTGGHIKVYSEVGVGTTVRIYLPRHIGSAAAPAHTTYNEYLVERGTERLLVVEDDELVRRHVATQLEGLGYSIVTAANAAEALERYRQDAPFDLLLTDVVMPGGMNGRELARAVRAITPTLPVLFTSGYTENAIVHHGRLDHGVHLLSKPYRLATLSRKVRHALGTQNRIVPL